MVHAFDFEPILDLILKVANANYEQIFKVVAQGVFYTKASLKYFAKFTGKHLRGCLHL